MLVWTTTDADGGRSGEKSGTQQRGMQAGRVWRRQWWYRGGRQQTPGTGTGGRWLGVVGKTVFKPCTGDTCSIWSRRTLVPATTRPCGVTCALPHALALATARFPALPRGPHAVRLHPQRPQPKPGAQPRRVCLALRRPPFCSSCTDGCPCPGQLCGLQVSWGNPANTDVPRLMWSNGYKCRTGWHDGPHGASGARSTIDGDARGWTAGPAWVAWNADGKCCSGNCLCSENCPLETARCLIAMPREPLC